MAKSDLDAILQATEPEAKVIREDNQRITFRRNEDGVVVKVQFNWFVDEEVDDDDDLDDDGIGLIE